MVRIVAWMSYGKRHEGVGCDEEDASMWNPSGYQLSLEAVTIE